MDRRRRAARTVALMSLFTMTDTQTNVPIASFDGDGSDLNSLIVGIEPVQDLHGYDNPWPAGGGKNKCYDDVSHLFPRGDGLTIVTDAETLTAYAKVPKNTDCVFSCSGGQNRNMVYGFEQEPAVGVVCHALQRTQLSPTSHLFNSGEYEYVGYYYGTSPTTNVMIELGSTATAWAPYSNICPISGWTGAKVTRTGKNLFDIAERSQNQTNANGDPSSGYTLTNGVLSISKDAFNYGRVMLSAIQMKSGAYTLSFTVSKSGSGKVIYSVRDMNSKTDIVAAIGTEATSITQTFTVTSDAPIAISIQPEKPATGTVSITNIQLELGSTATSYEPYQGKTCSITFPSSAGTVYGGTLDVTMGKLTVDRANIASYNGETMPSTWISDRDVYAVGTTPTTGAQVVYKLATPIVYDLTPTQVTTLIGTNNIWADTGDIKYIEYNI